MVEKKVLEKALTAAIEDGNGKRKFTQSVDLAINFGKDVDFKKAENRVSVDIILPHPPKPLKICVFADGQLALEAKNAGADLIVPGTDIPKLATDKALQKQVVECSILATPPLMAQVGKVIGQLLAGKGKSPKPIMPNLDIKEVIRRTRATINVRSRGKYLPTVHCIVGTEKMPVTEISDNILAVMESVEKKIPESKMSSLFVKTTMGKAFKVKLGG